MLISTMNTNIYYHASAIIIFIHFQKVHKEHKDEEPEGSGADLKSSIDGIPKVRRDFKRFLSDFFEKKSKCTSIQVFPKLPKAPVAAPNPDQMVQRQQAVVADDVPFIPSIPSAPVVPEGGMLPADIRRAPQSVGEV